MGGRARRAHELRGDDRMVDTAARTILPLGIVFTGQYQMMSENEAGDRARTDDLLITNQTLCQLSYTGPRTSTAGLEAIG
jgi:hypothetical protein